jgi:hypothetical protein
VVSWVPKFWAVPDRTLCCRVGAALERGVRGELAPACKTISINDYYTVEIIFLFARPTFCRCLHFMNLQDAVKS